MSSGQGRRLRKYTSLLITTISSSHPPTAANLVPVVESRSHPDSIESTRLDMPKFCRLLGHSRSVCCFHPRDSLFQAIRGINTTTWTVGSILLQLGLSVGQAMAMVIYASAIIAVLAVGADSIGSHQHLGLTRVSRRYSDGDWSTLVHVLTRVQLMGYARCFVAGDESSGNWVHMDG